MEAIAVKTPITLILKLRAKKTLADIRRHFVGSSVTAVLTETPNGSLLVPVDDLSVARKLAHSGGYDQDHLQTLAALLNHESNLLIVGTHVGAILVPLAKKCKEVVGVEANPDTYHLLTKNILLNGLQNVTTLPLAAWDSESELDFLKSSVNSGGSKVDTGSSRAEFHYDHPSKCRVPARRLDDVLPGRKFDLIIVDIEGAEYRALLGMALLLSQANELLVEVLPNHIDNVAMVSRSAFLTAIPAHFEYACILGELVIHERAGFHAMLQSIWEANYFGGVDVLFARSRERLIQVNGGE